MTDTAARQDETQAKGSGTRDAGILNSSMIMAAGTVVSRLTGFGRAAVISAALGLTAVTVDVFNIPNVLPNMLYILVGGGVLNSVLVPALVRAIKNDADGGKAYSERLFSLTVAVLGVATVLAVLAAPWIIRLTVDDSYLDPGMRPFYDNMVMFARFCLPQIFFYGLYVLIGQMLNAKGRFGPMMWSPILNNVIAITVFGTYLIMMGQKSVEPFTDTEVLVLGLGSTLGVVAQAAFLIPVLRKVGFSLRFRVDWRGHGLSESVRLGLWTFGFVAVNQLAYLFVVKVASGASAITAGGNDGAGYTVYANAMLIMMVPHSVITVSLATALLPRLSDLASDGDLETMRTRLVSAIRTCLAIIIPLGALVGALAFPIAAMIFGYGAASGQTDTLALTLMLLMPGLVGFTMHYMALRGFYAVQDTRTPFFTQIWISAVMIAGAIAISIVAPDNRIVTTLLAGGYSLAYIVGSSIGLVRLQHRIGTLDIPGLVQHVVRVALPSLVAAGLAWLVWWGWVQIGLLEALPSMLTRMGELLVGGTVGLATFIGLAYAMRISEVRQGVAMVVAKLRRRGGAEAEPAVDPGDLLEDTAEHLMPVETGTLSIFRRQGQFDPEMTAEFFLDETMHGVPGFWEAAVPSYGDTLARGRSTAVSARAPEPVTRASTVDIDTQPELPPDSHRSLSGSLAEAGHAIAGRYRLEQLLDDSFGARAWRAVDDVLRRSVFLQTVPTDDSRAAAFSAAARQASTIGDPRFLRILDIGTEGVTYVVREWTPGRSLAALLAGGALQPEQAAAIAREVADAMSGAHTLGLSHRCLGPTLVFVTSEGAVKIGGLETEAALHGRSLVIDKVNGRPITDPSALDAAGIGNLLYAGLTARWPTGATSGLQPAPLVDGRLASPRQVRPGVPRILDVITDRAIGHASRHHAAPLASPAAVAGELNALTRGRTLPVGYDELDATGSTPPALIDTGTVVPLAEPDDAPARPRRERRESSSLARTFGVVGSGLLLVGAALVGLQLLLGAFDDDGAERRPVIDETTTSTPSQPPNADPTPIAITGGQDFDPESSDGNGEESPDDVPLAFDGDPSTVWQTVTYYDPLEAQKEGVGVFVDLGEASSISQVNLQLAGAGGAVELLVAPQDATEAPAEYGDWTRVATLDDAEAEVTQALDEAVTSRYLLVWFTELPSSEGNYRGGIAEVEVLG